MLVPVICAKHHHQKNILLLRTRLIAEGQSGLKGLLEAFAALGWHAQRHVMPGLPHLYVRAANG